MDYKALGQNIREERVNQNLTQKDLADATHVTPAYIGQIERGERNVSLDVLIQIANTLNISVDGLVEYTYSNSLQRKGIYRELVQILQSCSKKELQLVLQVTKELVAYLDEKP